jgi:hypothetical protein
MRCPSCGTENAPGSRFCGGCGARLALSGQRVAPTQKISDDASFPQPPGGGGHAMPVTVPGVASPRPLPSSPYASGPAGVPRSAPASGARPITAPPPQRSSAPTPAQRPITAPPPHRSTTAPPPQRAITAPPPQRAITAPPPQRATTAKPPSRPPANGAVASARAPQPEDPSTSLPTAARRPWTLIIIVLLLDIGLAIAGGWMLSAGLEATPAAPPPSAVTPPAAPPRPIEVTPIEPRAATSGSADPHQPAP